MLWSCEIIGIESDSKNFQIHEFTSVKISCFIFQPSWKNPEIFKTESDPDDFMVADE